MVEQPEEECVTCQSEEKEEAQSKGNEMSEWAKTRTKEFANAILKVLGKYKDKRDEIMEKFLGVPKEKMSKLTTSFPFYKRTQAIYALNMFPKVSKNCKILTITNLSGDGPSAPQFERLRIKRKEKATLLTVGEFMLEWKGTKLILELYFCGMSRRARLWHRTEDVDAINEFQDEISKYMRKKNFLKGERLVFLPHANIDFLEYPKLDWTQVILKNEIREEIMLNLVFPVGAEKKCKASGIPWRRGVLMGGVAGTGKTQICRILCNVLPKSVTIIWATPKSLYDVEKIQNLFEAARYFSPTLIVIEDIDFIGQSRDFGRHNSVLGELLTQLDGNDPNHGLFIVATTNKPQLLDSALANRPSRFDVKLEVSLPDENERVALVKLFTKEMKFEHPLDYDKIATISEGLTGAHIKEVFVYAQLKALKRGTTKIDMADVYGRIRQCEKERQSGKQREYAD